MRWKKAHAAGGERLSREGHIGMRERAERINIQQHSSFDTAVVGFHARLQLRALTGSLLGWGTKQARVKRVSHSAIDS